MSATLVTLPTEVYAGLTVEQRVSRSHSQIMRHDDFKLLTGIVMIGRLHYGNTRTACTDGENVWYGKAFTEALTEREVNGLVLHENGHKFLCHLSVWKHLVAENARRANRAMDYVVNGWIIDTDPQGKFAVLPEGALYKPEWSRLDVGAVYRLLKEEDEKKQEQQEQGEGGESGGEPGDGEPGDGEPGEPGDGPLDEHDHEGAGNRTDEEEEELKRSVEQALREGAIMVGKAKGKLSETVMAALYPKIDWREVMQNFLIETTSGADDATWRNYNRRYINLGAYLPDTESETVGEIGIGIDVSGSISGEKLSNFLAEVLSLCKAVTPSRIRIFYWDVVVEREQIEDETSRISNNFNVPGGGGTRAGCVSDYILENGYNLDALIMFTDGYVEDRIRWEIKTPTLWVIDGKEDFTPPAGGLIVKK
jgi:predicted metal-dependent peptidase